MRLGGPAQQVTCSQDHEYTAEQKAFHGGAMDQFIENTEVSDCKPPVFKVPGMVMAYYDGNSVTALWNFAQHYAMSDNSYDTTFGPSTPGHLNLVSGQTHGVTKEFMPGGRVPDGRRRRERRNGQGTVIGDAQPSATTARTGIKCSSARTTRTSVTFSTPRRDVGLLRGRVQADLDQPDGTAVCGATPQRGGDARRHGQVGPAAARYKGRLHPAPRAVPVLPLDGEPPSPAARLGRQDRPNRLGQPPIRPLGLLGRCRRAATCPR